MTPPFVVVDSSVIVKWLSQHEEQNLRQADALLTRAQDNAISLAAPELAKFEIGNALAYKCLPTPELIEVITLLYTLPITFFPWDAQRAARTAELAVTYDVTYYDAAFVCLAEHLHTTLITDNPKHQRKIKGVNVIPLKQYR